MLDPILTIIMQKEGFDMDQKTMDREWQQLQAHIVGFLGQAIRSDTQAIEYKPRFITHLLETPIEYSKGDYPKFMHK